MLGNFQSVGMVGMSVEDAAKARTESVIEKPPIVETEQITGLNYQTLLLIPKL